ncbi:MAG TPA: hypothetical protein VHV77_08355, partial [Pirellulales bacterium]|nr:hypothetical protein [Pirellulales bacterium]
MPFEPFRRFRLWLLLLYAVFGTAMFSSIVLLSRTRPTPEVLGEAGYIAAWRSIVIGGALMGCTTYLISLWQARRG